MAALAGARLWVLKGWRGGKVSMGDSFSTKVLSIGPIAEASLIAAARDAEPVRGLTHGYYKYPARFSPTFARAAIEAFTAPGDLCIDPHVGGGTTLVEALALGRRAVGADISTLAGFVSGAKTVVFDPEETARLRTWARDAPRRINMREPSETLTRYAELGYYKHLGSRNRWRLRKAVEQGLADAVRLGDPRLETFARCAVLRTAQWALDGRSRRASIADFRVFYARQLAEMLAGAEALATAVRGHGLPPQVMTLNRSAAGLESDERLSGLGPAKLVLTSPPYPGVHVLYHRWQVDGRKESPLPFMIAGQLDGAGSSYYTMGDRKPAGVSKYFQAVMRTTSSVACLAGPETIFVQMLAFSDPGVQLPQYLACMEAAGLEEHRLPSLVGQGDGRLWRDVPGRRWYNGGRTKAHGGREVVLLHRLVRQAPLGEGGTRSVVGGPGPQGHRDGDAVDLLAAVAVRRIEVGLGAGPLD